ncbi:TrmH family RNA methyltransferase [Bowmanella dokdonensis]|uniref:RNA methyltransferase n=1 Tax=Bowmanella dokdonensis TaxID=751969 RepID=A0A939DKL5_9ALTE|nr:RNA methyltransferase [Bowmanella dokdonensis]MBN7824274.1 RNA methyltransferase [Bowmanella dokdonensis]
MKLDDVKKLHQKKYRAQLGCYLVEGEHLILELAKAAKTQPGLNNTVLYVTQKYQQWAGQLDSQFTLVTLNDRQMAHISDTKTPQGIIACVPLPDLTRPAVAPGQAKRCVYLHEIQDPGNLGTILRTLAWFGGFRLLLSPNSVDPFNPKVVRASMGAIFHVPLELEVELSQLPNRFNRFAYLDMQGTRINRSEFFNYDCYLFGNEARGVPTEALAGFKADAFTIQGSGHIDSLNLASAVSICMYQLSV